LNGTENEGLSLLPPLLPIPNIKPEIRTPRFPFAEERLPIVPPSRMPQLTYGSAVLSFLSRAILYLSYALPGDPHGLTDLIKRMGVFRHIEHTGPVRGHLNDLVREHVGWF